MKIFIICSKKFYGQIPSIKEELEKNGHVITLPNSYEDPGMEEKQRSLGNDEHARWKSEMIRHSGEAVSYTHLTLPTKRIV